MTNYSGEEQSPDSKDHKGSELDEELLEFSTDPNTIVYSTQLEGVEGLLVREDQVSWGRFTLEKMDDYPYGDHRALWEEVLGINFDNSLFELVELANNHLKLKVTQPIAFKDHIIVSRLLGSIMSSDSTLVIGKKTILDEESPTKDVKEIQFQLYHHENHKRFKGLITITR